MEIVVGSQLLYQCWFRDLAPSYLSNWTLSLGVSE